MSAAATPAQPVAAPPPPAPVVVPAVEVTTPVASAAGSAPAPAVAATTPSDVAPVAAPVGVIDEPPLQPNGARVVADAAWGKFKEDAEKRALAKAKKAVEDERKEALKGWQEVGFVSEEAAKGYLAMLSDAKKGTAPAPDAPPTAAATPAPAVTSPPAPVAGPVGDSGASAKAEAELAAARAEAMEARMELEAIRAGAKHSDWAVLQLNKHLRTLPADQAKTFSTAGFFADLKGKHPDMFGAPPQVREVPVTTAPGGTPPAAPSPAAVSQQATRVDYSKLTPEQQRKYDAELDQSAARARAKR